MPEESIVDEGISFGAAFYVEPQRRAARLDAGHRRRHRRGLPCAAGAAVAAPAGGSSRAGDGSAMYTLQALWTKAREKLPVTTVIFANRKYQILIGE